MQTIRPSTFIKNAILVLLSILLFSCGGSDDSNNATPTLAAISNQSTNQGVIKQIRISANDADGDVLSYALSSDPKGQITGTVANSILTLTPDPNYAGTATLTLRVSDGQVHTETSFKLAVAPNDPLYQYQWHLDNQGQTNFASNAGTYGEDINFDSVIAAGYTGKDVVVAVVDTGLEIAHEDLAGNVVSGGSWDFVGEDTDPTTTATDGDHGTSVAGLVAASGWNGKGGRGVAPLAQLKGFNVLKSQDTINFTRSLGGNNISSDVHIFNQSYGISTIEDFLIDPTVEGQYRAGVTSLRDGKGAIYIKSSGNGFTDYVYGNDNTNCSELYDHDYNLSCQNANMDPHNTVPYNIVVGALAATGKKSSYSTAGSSIWVVAPGGEDGSDHPAMMTTDQSGCDQGYVRNTVEESPNDFDNGNFPHAENPNCRYTSTFNGTSSAAPVLSGAVALILEANPYLTWRDIKHILASTADQVDASIGATTLNIGGAPYIAEPGWLTNNAGYKFHNYYGFGRVNVGKAVVAAKAYTTNLGTFTEGEWVSSNTIATPIPNGSVVGAASTISINDNTTIEAVQIKVNLTHQATGALAIELISPAGTRSVLFTPANGFTDSADLTNMVLLTNAFYGESSSGTWTVKVIDAGWQGDSGTLTDWSIRIFGH